VLTWNGLWSYILGVCQPHAESWLHDLGVAVPC